MKAEIAKDELIKEAREREEKRQADQLKAEQQAEIDALENQLRIERLQAAREAEENKKRAAQREANEKDRAAASAQPQRDIQAQKKPWIEGSGPFKDNLEESHANQQGTVKAHAERATRQAEHQARNKSEAERIEDARKWLTQLQAAEDERKRKREAAETKKKLELKAEEALKQQKEADEAKKRLAHEQWLEQDAKLKRELAFKEEQANIKRKREREAAELKAKRKLELEEAEAEAKLFEQKTIEAERKEEAAKARKREADRLRRVKLKTDTEKKNQAEKARIEQELAQEKYELEARDAYEQEAFKQLLYELEIAGPEFDSVLEQVNINKVAVKNPADVIQRLLPIKETKKADWLELKNLLHKHNISRLYHFTDRENLVSIRAAGGLLSWYSCKQNGIDIARPGGSEASWQLDSYKGLADYVRLAFIPDHPMLYVAKKDGRLKSPVVLEIDPAVIFLQETKFSEMNAVKNGVFANGELDKFLEIRFNVFKKRYFDLTDDEKPYYQAEVLIHKMLPAKYILNLDRLPV